MVHCGRCGSGFSAARMRAVTFCPRCLLRSDVPSPLMPGPPMATAKAPEPQGMVDVATQPERLDASPIRPTG
jgi:hypothetical protein